MSNVATTKMSSRGQIVIPEEVRNRLGLTQGSQFVLFGDGDVILLDTNVLISGVFFGGRPRRVLEAWRDDRYASLIRSNRRGERPGFRRSAPTGRLRLAGNRSAESGRLRRPVSCNYPLCGGLYGSGRWRT